MAAGEVKIDTLTDQEDTLTSAIPLQLYKHAKHVQLQEPASARPVYPRSDPTSETRRGSKSQVLSTSFWQGLRFGFANG